MIKNLRKIFIIFLPLLTLTSGILLKIDQSQVWINWVFLISLSGTVGMWTNYFAIKMLFKPYQKTAFGRQGLIPAKRQQIAEAVSAAVAEELLNTNSILKYIKENDLIRNTTSGILNFIHKWLDDKQNRDRVITFVGKYIQEKGVEHAGIIMSEAADFIRDYASRNLTTEKVWHKIRKTLQKEFQQPETIQLMGAITTKLIEDNAHLLAKLIDDIIIDWLESQKFIFKKIGKLGKDFFGINHYRIKSELLKSVKSPTFSAKIMDIIENNVESFLEMGEGQEIKERFTTFLEDQKERLDEWIKTEGVIVAKNNLIKMLSSDRFWQWLENQIDSIITMLKNYGEQKIQSKEFRETAGEFVMQAIKKFEIKEMVRNKVNEFELHQLENLISRVSGDNLAGIELFGGILGMLAGLILIDQWFIIGLPVTLMVLWLIEKFFTRVST